MTVYLLHFTPPYKRASHYIGYTPRQVSDRFDDHIMGRGSPLVAAAVATGCYVTLEVIWPGAGRDFERWLKAQKHAYRWCPHCGKGKWTIPQPENITARFRSRKQEYVEALRDRETTSGRRRKGKRGRRASLTDLINRRQPTAGA